ncbi:hypothetical protein [Actinomadura sp. NTSP31]|uniref:hypothetical protein n=1 Tax=Actinomadura sp. NTSP31 TaxID=1735447 RepID=UPI0035C0FBE9
MGNIFVVLIAITVTSVALLILRHIVKRRQNAGDSTTFWQWLERASWVTGSLGTLLAILVLISASGSNSSPDSPTEIPYPAQRSQPVNAGRAPWDAPQLREDEAPKILVHEWRRANNRDDCAPIAPAQLGAGAGAHVRRATFDGGWGITYEDARGDFTIAGTSEPASGGVDPADPWRYHVRWNDGSIVGYGTEGGQYGGGPDSTTYLAYLAIPGQGCLYNISTKLGKGHLEYLLTQLRIVNVSE